MATDFVVGAVFTLDPVPAVDALATIGRAFETVDAALAATLRTTTTMVDAMVVQIERIGAAWKAAAAEAGRVGRDEAIVGGGGRVGPTRARAAGLTDQEYREREDIRFARMNAEAENRDIDRIYRRQYNEAILENMERDRLAKMDDGISIPRPPRTGITTYDYGRSTPPPRTITGDLPKESEKRPTATSEIGMLEIGEILAGVFFYKQAGEAQLALAQAAENLNIRPDDPGFKGAIEEMVRSAREASSLSGTVFSLPEAIKGLSAYAGVMMQTGDVGLDRVVRGYPVAARAGELSAKRGMGKLEDEAVAIGQTAHLAGAFTPETMEPFIDEINAIAKREHTSFKQQADIMRYGMPLAIAAGIDPARAAGEIAYGESIMRPSTRAGTAYGQFITSLVTAAPARTESGRQKQRELEREFEKALLLEGEDTQKEGHASEKGDKRLTALKELGIYGPDNKPLAVNAKGNIDEKEAERLIGEYAKTHTDTLTQLKYGFGLIGARYAELFIDPEALARQEGFIGYKSTVPGERGVGIMGAPTVQQEQEDLMRGAFLLKFEQSWANIQTIIYSMTNETLPAFSTALDGINFTLRGIGNFLTGPPDAPQNMLLKTGAGALLGGVVGGIVGLVTGGPGGAIAGAGAGALWGARGGLTWGAISSFFDYMKAHPEIQSPEFGGLPPGSPLLPQQQPQIPTMRVTPGAAQGPTMPGSPPNVTVGPVTLSGVADESTFQRFLDRIVAAVTLAMGYSTSSPAGTQMSPYTQPGWTP